MLQRLEMQNDNILKASNSTFYIFPLMLSAACNFLKLPNGLQYNTNHTKCYNDICFSVIILRKFIKP